VKTESVEKYLEGVLKNQPKNGNFYHNASTYPVGITFS